MKEFILEQFWNWQFILFVYMYFAWWALAILVHWDQKKDDQQLLIGVSILWLPILLWTLIVEFWAWIGTFGPKPFGDDDDN